MHHYSDRELLEEFKKRFRLDAGSLVSLFALHEELRLVNAKLQESEKVKSQFLSNVRNEMNNPLAALLGLSVDMIRLAPNQTEQIQRMAALIHLEAFNLDFQLRNILAAAELEAGEMVIERANTHISGIVHQLLKAYQPLIQQKRLRVAFQNGLSEEENTPFYFRTDPAKFQLILSNLIANAIEFSHPEGVISITWGTQEAGLYLSVQDEGIGIETSEQDTIFNRFVQLDRGLTRNYRGHGLGLAVVKALQELLGGSITLVSGKGTGSCFSICLPELSPEGEVDDIATDGNELFFGREIQ